MIIKIRDPALNLLAYIDDYYSDVIHEAINKEFTFSFDAIIDGDKSQYIVTDNIVEVENNYFQIVYLQKKRNQDGTLTVEVDCEHVAQTILNLPAFNMDTFTMDDTPANILAAILAGTGFTVGTVDFTALHTLSLQEKDSRRGLLIKFGNDLGGEYLFDKYTIHLLQRRGADNGVQFRVGKNLKGVTVHQDKRSGTLETAYDIDMIELSSLPEYGSLEAVELGDTVRVMDIDLGVDEKQRIMQYDFSPKLRMNSRVTIANFLEGIEDVVSQIQRITIIKEKIYNGIKIGPENGFEAIRSDKKARTVMNATEGIKIQSGDGSGSSWTDKLYADLNGNLNLEGIIKATGGLIGGWIIELDRLSGSGKIEGGEIIGSSINIGSGNFTVDVNGIMTAIGALIKSAAGYPRIELNSTNNLIAAYADADTYIAFIPQGTGAVPTLVLVDGGITVGFLNRIPLGGTTLGTSGSEPLNFQPAGDLQIEGVSGITGNFAYVKDVVAGVPDYGTIFVKKGIVTNIT